MCDNDIDLQPDELGCDLGEAFGASLCPTIFNGYRASFDPVEFAQSLHEGSGQMSLRCRGRCAQEADGRQFPRLLSPRRERPRGRAAEQRDERTSFHYPMPPVLRTERIAHLGTEETAALWDFDPAYDRSGS